MDWRIIVDKPVITALLSCAVRHKFRLCLEFVRDALWARRPLRNRIQAMARSVDRAAHTCLIADLYES